MVVAHEIEVQILAAGSFFWAYVYIQFDETGTDLIGYFSISNFKVSPKMQSPFAAQVLEFFSTFDGSDEVYQVCEQKFKDHMKLCREKENKIRATSKRHLPEEMVLNHAKRMRPSVPFVEGVTLATKFLKAIESRKDSNDFSEIIDGVKFCIEKSDVFDRL